MRKNWRGGDELLWKNDTLVITVTNHVILGPVYIAPGPWYFRDFSNIFLPNKGEDKKKSYDLRAGPWHCVIWWIRPWLVHYVHKRVRWGPEGATFRTKLLNFIRVIYFNCLAKSNWWGPSFLVVNIIVNYYCTRVLLYTKMLKETEEIRLFVTFFLLMAFQLGGLDPPSATPMIVTSMLFVILRFCVLFCLFALVCMPKRH